MAVYMCKRLCKDAGMCLFVYMCTCACAYAEYTYIYMLIDSWGAGFWGEKVFAFKCIPDLKFWPSTLFLLKVKFYKHEIKDRWRTVVRKW